MSETSPPFYITTPIYYVNDKPHLGHVYTTMVADVIARYHRLRGDDVFFLTGVDEHAAKVADEAVKRGLSPQEWADQNAAAFRDVFGRLEMTNDDFVRTSEDRHKSKVTEYVRALLDCGDVYPGEYEGWYDAGQEEYVTESKAKEYDYKSPVNGKPLVRKKEKNYFFKLSAYRDQLLKYYEQHPQFVQPDARRNEIVNRIKEAQDVPISRTGMASSSGGGGGGWGIPMPGDPDQTIYVWIDALFNYLTYVDTPDRRKYWQAGAVHLIAKDILWFHASIWPAILMALKKCPGFDNWHDGQPLAMPTQIYCHSYWVSESGEKMSKSLGNFLDPAAIDNYVNEFGLDALRYFLATRGPLGVSDSAFSPDLFIEVYNNELANTFGNSCSRVTNMIGKYFDGHVPEEGPPVNGIGLVGATARTASGEIDGEGFYPYQRYLEVLDLNGLGQNALTVVRGVDKSIEITEPFKRAKQDGKLPEVGTILYNCNEGLRVASLLIWPFIPDAVELFWQRIGCDYAEQMKASGGRGKLDEWVEWGPDSGGLKPGTRIEKGDALFPRYQVK